MGYSEESLAFEYILLALSDVVKDGFLGHYGEPVELPLKTKVEVEPSTSTFRSGSLAEPRTVFKINNINSLMSLRKIRHSCSGQGMAHKAW
jgi:hypothetical protein